MKFLSRLYGVEGGRIVDKLGNIFLSRLYGVEAIIIVL